MKFTRMINFRMLIKGWEFLSFLTGSRERDFEDERKRSVLAFFMILGIGITFPFAIHHFSIGNMTRAILILCLGSVQFASLMALRFLKRANIIFRLNVLLVGIYFLFLISVGGTYGSRILWVFIFPIFAFFLLGKREGLFWSVLLILFSLLLFVNPANFFGTFPYESEIKTRFVITYTLLVLMGYFVEATRQRYHEGVQDYAGFLSTLAAIRGLGPEKSEAALWQVFLSSIVKEYGFLMVWYGIYSDGQVVPKHSAGRADRYLDDLVLEIREPTSPDARCAMSRAILGGQPFGYEDLANDEGFRRWRDYALELGYHSNVALPFEVNGRIEGGIMIYAGTVAAFPAKRVEHLHLLTSEMENTVQERRQVRQAKVALQNSYDQLERRVEERTTDLKDANEQLKLEVLERKQAEEALQKSEERFRELAENIREVFWLFDWKAQRVLYVSPAYEEIWGRSTQDLYNRYEEWGDSIHPDDVPYAEESFNKILETGGGEDREYRIVRPDGTVRWVLDRGFAIRGEDDEVKRIAGIAEDITERKRVVEERERLTSILESTSDLVSTSTIDGRLTYMNSAGRKLLDWDLRADLSDKYISDVHPQWANQIIEKEGLPTAQEQGLWIGETAVSGKNGEEIPVSQVIMSHQSPAGKVDYFSTIMRDMREQKRMEEVLITSERNYREIFEKTDDAMFIHGVDGRILDVNQSTCNIFGFAREEALKKMIQDFSQGDPPYSQVEAGSFVKKAFEEGPQQFEWLAKRKSGELFWAEVNLKHARIGDQDRIIAAVRDISERKRSEQELAKYRERLEELVTERSHELEKAQEELLKRERLTVLGQLTATVSHELRNPLGVIRSSSFYVQQKYKGQNEKVKKHINRIEDQVEICDSIVGDLLEYTRGRHSQMIENEINPWLKQILDEMPEAEGVKIEKVLADYLPKVLFDKEKMRRVVVNLMDNALQAIKERKLMEKNDSYRPSIEVSSNGKDGDIMITVKDNGIGMDEETVERAFEPLFTTKARGTGLGLANVEKILHEHNGSILLESKPHDGTTVRITIPAVTKE